jgi:RecJ-like exonuclease
VTDPIECPECDGSGEQRIGSLTLQCRFCHGHGKVGGEYEPAEEGRRRPDGYRQPIEGEEYDPDIHGPLPAVWEHPAVANSGLCTTCLGARVVISPTLVEEPCPACSAP